MRTLDFAPLYRSAIGFDRLASLMETATRSDNQSSFPPYNIELLEEDKYRITMAVAGFSQEELDIEVEQDALRVSGSKAAETDDHHFLHQGIAARNFERQFRLADHVKVIGAKVENGLLHIDLEREIPEAMKPRKIQIAEQTSAHVLHDKAA